MPGARWWQGSNPCVCAGANSFCDLRSCGPGGEEAKDFAHNAVGLICLEQELGVGGTIENDQFFWLGRFHVLFANSGESGTIFVCVIAGHENQAARARMRARMVQTVPLLGAWAGSALTV